MRQQGSVEDRPTRHRLPDQLLDGEAALHCVNRNVAERVIGEMQRHIDVKDEAGRESDLAKAGHCGSICANTAKSSSMQRLVPAPCNPSYELRSRSFRSGPSRPSEEDQLLRR